MRKFGDKSKEKQTVFIVSCTNKTENEEDVLAVFNSLENTNKYIERCYKEDEEMGWDVEYSIVQRDIDDEPEAEL